MNTQEIKTNKEHYYVTVLDGKRKGFLLGPYSTRQEALDNVERGKKLALDNDDFADFYYYGTAGSDDIIKTVFGK
jgi:uncharacterized protein YegJ (DUF2314 family)